MSLSDRNTSTRLKVTIISLAMVVMGLVLLLIYAFANTRLPAWFASVLQELASVLIISGSLSAISEYFMRGDFVTEIKQTEERLRMSMYTSDRQQRLGEYGVVDCIHDSINYSFAKFLTEAKDVTLCLNEGRSWMSANLQFLTTHMQVADSSTTILLANPESDYARILSDKTGDKLSYLTEKIKDTCRRIIDEYEKLDGDKGSLKIYWHDLPVVNGIYFSDKMALVTPYKISRFRAAVPLFIISKNEKPSYYEFIRTDLEHLLHDTTVVTVYAAERGKLIHRISELPIQDDGLFLEISKRLGYDLYFSRQIPRNELPSDKDVPHIEKFWFDSNTVEQGGYALLLLLVADRGYNFPAEDSIDVTDLATGASFSAISQMHGYYSCRIDFPGSATLGKHVIQFRLKDEAEKTFTQSLEFNVVDKNG